MEAGRESNGTTVNSGELRTDIRSALGGTGQAVPVLDKGDDVLPAVANVSIDTTPADHAFKFRVEQITSSILVVVCFALNWYSAFEGRAQYVPEWAIGFVLYGYGAKFYDLLKGKMFRSR